MEGLEPGLDVRILEFWGEDLGKGWVESFSLEPGDVLYLPPKFGHCGTALTDGCMTLSVGLRAPSAKDMMTKMMDHVSEAMEGKILDRYTDPNLLDGIVATSHGHGHGHGHDHYANEDDNDNDHDDNGANGANDDNAINAINELDSEVKLKAKQLVRDAINEMLDDDVKFDEFFGKLVTESNRMRFDYPPSLDDLLIDDGCKEELGAVWSNAKNAVEAVMINGYGVLYVAEGLALAYSNLDLGMEKICRLFIDGTMMEVSLDGGGGIGDGDSGDDGIVLDLIKRMVDDRQISQASFKTNTHDVTPKMRDFLEHLVQEGYLYGADE
jgi:hypothetical protein